MATTERSEHVTVVTVTYGDRVEHLAATLAGVQGLDRGEAVRRIVVVANGAATATHRFLATASGRDPRIDVVTLPRNEGSAGGYAAGIAAAATDAGHIWLLDDDNRPRRDALARLLDETDRLGPGAALQSLRPSYPGLAQAATGKPVSARHMVRPRVTGSAIAEKATLEWSTYGGFFASAEAFRRAGLPRTDFVVYADDTEYTHRFPALGYPIHLVVDSVVDDVDRAWWAPPARSGPSPVPGLQGDDARRRMFYTVRNSVYFRMTRTGANRAGVLAGIALRVAGLTLLCSAAAARRRSREPLRNLGVYLAATHRGIAGRLGPLEEV